MADMQWYQTDLEVTVSLRFSDVDLKTVSGKFENDMCALLAEGKHCFVLANGTENNTCSLFVCVHR